MFTREVLQTVKIEELREWARVNGADMNQYDQILAAWEDANSGTGINTSSAQEE